MAQDSEAPVDLLGFPMSEPKDPRGRKRHKRLPQVAETVALLRGAGHTEDEIAAIVGLSDKTVRKYYSRELQKGPKIIRGVLTVSLFAQAKKGKAAAARLVREILADGDAAVPLPPGLHTPAADTDDDEPLGKKAAADRDAKTAHEGTKWGRLLN
jgi:hypothetical protein